MSSRYHIGYDGTPKPCKAKTPEACKCKAPDGIPQFHGSLREVEEKIADEYKNKATGEAGKNSLSKTNDQDAAGLVESLSNDEKPDSVDNDGRTISLLSDQMQLAEDRKGKVPVLKPDDDSVSAQSKLAKYIINNMVGDRTQSEEDAIKTLYGGEITMIADDDESFGYGAKGEDAKRRRALSDREKKYLEHQTGGEVHRYWNGSRLLFVCSSRRTGKTTTPDGVLRSNGVGVKVASLDYGNLQAASAVFKRMGMENESEQLKRTVAYGLMESDRKYTTVEFLNRTGVLDPEIIKKCNSNDVTRDLREHGLEMQDAPVVTDLSDESQRNSMAAYYQQAAYKYVNSFTDKSRSEAERADMFQKSRVLLDYESKIKKLGVKERYQEAITGLLRDESNSEMNKAFLKRSKVAHSATVYEDKKNRDPKHDEAGRRSKFQQDFGHIEVDDSVDLGKFDDLSKEYSDYRHLLPAAAVTPDLRFRYTGRHKATGLYTTDGKGLYNVAVDPRYPSSMTHELFHHFDFTSKKGRQISMDPEFVKIVEHYQATVDYNAMGRANPDNYIAPTEVFARAGELWMSERAGSSSFLDSKEEYASRFDFKPLLDMKDEVMAFMDKHFKARG